MAVINHSEYLEDRVAMVATRSYLALQPRLAIHPASRADYEAVIGGSPVAEDVTFEPAHVGGVGGWWCHPAEAGSDAALLHLHGGAYVLGSAKAYRNFVSQIASASGVAAFIPDYSLAPERPFPAAFEGAHAVLRGLWASGFNHVAVSGDSAGGGLALAVVQDIIGRSLEGMPEITGVAAMSPWTDLTLTSRSLAERASADPLLSRDQLAEAVRLYVGADRELRDPRLSPLLGATNGMPPVMIHVGRDEVLLDDAVNYVGAAEASGVTAEVHIWAGMTHVFPASGEALRAAKEAIKLIAAFLQGSLEGRA